MKKRNKMTNEEIKDLIKTISIFLLLGIVAVLLFTAY